MDIFIIGVIMIWLAMGFYGTLTLFRTEMDVDLPTLLMCILGSFTGITMLIVGLAARYPKWGSYVFFKKFDD